MNAMLRQVADEAKYLAVSGNRTESAEGRRDNDEAIMAALAGTGVAGMEVRVIGELQMQRRERCEAFAQQTFDVAGSSHQAGNTFLNGLIVTFS